MPQNLDLKAIEKGGEYLKGHHDFNAFRSAQCQSNNATKTLDTVSVYQPDMLLHLSFSSKSFLHNQVRIMVGTLIDIGKGRFAPEQILKAFESKDRADAGQTAPPYGLYFNKVNYIKN